MMMFIGLAAINTQANLLFGVFGLMIGILLVSFVISGMVIKKLRVERMLPDHAVVGKQTVVYYQITNQKRFWPSLSVTMSELDGIDAFMRQPSAYMLHCANRMVASVPADVTPRRRGVFEFDRFQLSTSFPFGFIKRAVDRRQRDSIVVLPAIGTMNNNLMQRFRSAESVGINVRPSQGGDDEFYGLKDYRTGENPRLINWKRSAHTGNLVVREMTRVSPPKLLVLVDTRHAEPTTEWHVAVERAIAMGATLIDRAMEAGLPIGLVTWSRDWTIVTPNRGKRHRLDLLTNLARLAFNDQIGPSEMLQKARPLTHRETTTVLITPSGGSPGIAQMVRGGLVVLSSREKEFTRYFNFPPEIDFTLGAKTRKG
jgi:uncharacterized protein (DUF58 family)